MDSKSNQRHTPKSTNPKTEAGVSGDPFVLGVIISVILIFLTIVYFWWTRKTKKGRCVLIIGAPEVGKTAIFTKLIADKHLETVTSVSLNQAEYLPDNKPALILKDLPGHERVREQFWDSNKMGARGLVCVVDAAGGNKAIREASEVLYTVLTDPSVLSTQPNILIFCNKEDLPTAKGTKVVRTQLERELTTLRMTKSATLQSTGGSSSSQKPLGKLDRDFDFEDMYPIKVEFVEGIGNKERSELKALEDWLAKIA